MCFSALIDAVGKGHVDMEWQTEVTLSLLAIEA